MKEILVDIGINVLLMCLGLALYATWMVRKYLRVFKFSIFWNENKAVWIWSVILTTLFAILLAVSPEAPATIKTLTGLDLVDETMSYITLGFMLSATAREGSKIKKTKSNQTDEEISS